MHKQVFTIGYEIPGKSDNCVNFHGTLSLMDADVLLISPNSFLPSGDYVHFTSSDGGCYNVETSKRYRQKIIHLKKEIKDHLDAGKNVFMFLTKEERVSLANSVSSQKKGQNTYNTESFSNYNFLPFDIGTLTSASGKHVRFSGNPIFSNFYNKFKEYLEYELYIENPNEAQVIFTGKDKSKILGAVYKVGQGHLVTLPMLNFNEEDLTEIKKDENGEETELWNKKGIAFGNDLVECLLEIDNKLTTNSEKTLAPEWVSKKQYSTMEEDKLRDLINKNNEKIVKIEKENEKLKAELEEEVKLKDLLFEQGKPLENAVIKALKLLGYQAENYNDGDLEIDQVIISPEGYRYIGESEGKDNKSIDVTKYRQLVDALNADFARDAIEEKAYGILFGNAERLTDPEKRKLDFTTKCKTGADREKIVLIKTIDLFAVSKYLTENNDEKFKKDCRDAIHKYLGKIVVFPSVINKEKEYRENL